jgi:hypothetical protein
MSFLHTISRCTMAPFSSTLTRRLSLSPQCPLCFYVPLILISLQKMSCSLLRERHCGLVVRVPDYRSRGAGFDSRRRQTFWEIVGLERCPLSIVNTFQKLLERKSSGFGLQSREYCYRDLLHWSLNTLYPQTLSLPSPTSGGRSRNEATEL